MTESTQRFPAGELGSPDRGRTFHFYFFLTFFLSFLPLSLLFEQAKYTFLGPKWVKK
jgi:hypothetical protein